MSDRLRQLDWNTASAALPGDAPDVLPRGDALPTPSALPAEWAVLESRYELRPPPVLLGLREVCGATERRGGRMVHISRLRERGANCRSPERFLERACRVADLDHPAIVRLCDFGHDAFGCFAVTEATDAEPLSDILAQSGPLDVETVTGLALTLGDALRAYHQQGIVHADICPATILINDAGDPQILDVSLFAAICDDPESESPDRRPPERAAFTAPECAQGRQPDLRSDVWSLGAVVHHLLTGGSADAARSDAIPPRLRAVVLQALDPDPTQRFPSAAEFQTALRSALGMTPIPAATVPTPEAVLPQMPPQPAAVDVGPECERSPSFRTWYDEKFRWTRSAGAVPSYVIQTLAWSALGFVWIPAWYFGSQSRDESPPS